MVYECHSSNAVVSSRKIQHLGTWFVPVNSGGEGKGKIAVNIGKSFQIAFGMAAGRALDGDDRRIDISAIGARMPNLIGSIAAADAQRPPPPPGVGPVEPEPGRADRR